MSDTTVNLLVATEAALGTELKPAGAVTALIAGQAAVIPMSTVRDASGGDAIGTPATNETPLPGATGMIGWLSGIYKRLGDALNIRALSSETDSVSVGNFPETQAVSAEALPLPTGAATQATLDEVKSALEGPLTLMPKTSEDFAEIDRAFTAAINPTIGVGVALTIATRTTYLDTQPSFIFVPTTKQVSLDKIRLRVATAGTALSQLQLVVIVDTVNRYSGGGTVITGKSSLTNSNATCEIRTGTAPIVATGTTPTERRAYVGTIKAAITAINDNYTFHFGNDAIFEQGLTTNTLVSKSLPPIVIPEGGSAMVYLFGAGMTAAPTFEGTVSFKE